MRERHFRLDGGGETLVITACESGPVGLAWWGPALPVDENLAAIAALSEPAVPHGILDGGEALSLLPQAGDGFSGHPGLILHRAGRDTLTQLRLTQARPEPGRLTLHLDDARAGVRVRISLALDSTGVLTLEQAISNTGATPLSIDWMAAGVFPLPGDELLRFSGRWTREFHTERIRLVGGLLGQENRTGRTSHHSPPFIVAGRPGFGESHGAVTAWHLAWSGDHRIFCERLRDGRAQVQLGELFGPGEMDLQPGESYAAPKVFAARSDLGLNGLSDRFHPFVRQRILTARGPRPVQFNSWEAVYFDHDVERLKALAGAAAAAGAERFVLDDGWFRGRRDDTAGLGDWVPDPDRYPQGLGPLIDHVRALGLEFGLWVEPEMANADSDLLRAHPDWVLGEPDRVQPLGRGQYVLDLTRPKVANQIFRQLDRLLTDYPIACLKWDMNRDLTHGVSGGRRAAHRQVLAAYSLIDRLRAAHPGVEIESCASGGARADYEILRRTDRIWTSDCNDPIERQRIQRTFSIFFPPEVMGAHVGPADSHTTARTTSLELRALTALFGHFGIEADISRFSDSDSALLAEAVAMHKRLRPILHGGRLARLEHEDPGLTAFSVAVDDTVLVSVAQLETPCVSPTAPLPLTALAEGYWTASLLNPRRRPEAVMKSVPGWARGEPLTASAGGWRAGGLPVGILRAGEIALWRLERGA